MASSNLIRSIGVAVNVGMLAGILFVAMELRRNNELQTSLAVVNMENELEEMWVDYPELATGLSKLYSGEELTEREEKTIEIHFERRFRNLQWHYLNSPETTFWSSVVGPPPHPRLREIWEATSAYRDPVFVEFMERDVFGE